MRLVFNLLATEALKTLATEALFRELIALSLFNKSFRDLSNNTIFSSAQGLIWLLVVFHGVSHCLHNELPKQMYNLATEALDMSP